MLVGNKIDLVPEGMTMDQLLLFEHIETSANNNVRFQEVFQMLLRSIEQARDYRAKYGVPEDAALTILPADLGLVMPLGGTEEKMGGIATTKRSM